MPFGIGDERINDLLGRLSTLGGHTWIVGMHRADVLQLAIHTADTSEVHRCCGFGLPPQERRKG